MSENKIEEATFEDALHCAKALVGDEMCEECRFYRLCHTWCDDVYRLIVDALSEIQQYREIGTVEQFKALKEKNTPMKHHHTRIDNISDEIRVSVCPNCLSIMYTHSEEYPVFCNACGQKLDWQ